MADASSAFRLAVLNPGGRDPDQHFPGGAGHPNDFRAAHPPVNYHAYVACVGGAFFANEKAALATNWPILLLLRRDLKSGWRCLQRLKAAGRTVAVTFKEAGAMQVAARLTKPADYALLRSSLALADGCLAPTPWLAEFFRGVCPTHGLDRTAFIPTPYPVDDPRWQLAIPPSERRGIFIGTREIDTPSRQHLAALAAGKRLHGMTGARVTVLNPDGRRGAKFLAVAGFTVKADGEADPALRLLPGPLAYLDYLRAISQHKIVFQLDRSAVPGQVAGDALLCDVPCVGGDGAVEGLAFPELCGHCREPAELVELATALLTNPSLYEQACRDARTQALETVSYANVAKRLETFFTDLPGK